MTLLLGGGAGDMTPARGRPVRRFETASEPSGASARGIPGCDVLVMAAAVADFIPEQFDRRIHRSEGPRSVVAAPGGGSARRRRRRRRETARSSPSPPNRETGRKSGRGRRCASKRRRLDRLNDVSKPGIGFDVGRERNRPSLELRKDGSSSNVGAREKLRRRSGTRSPRRSRWKAIPEQV